MPNNNNAYDLLRVIFAVFVIISHAYFFAGYPQYEPLTVLSKGQTAFGDIGLVGFFTLSGYLIATSYDRAKNVYQFLLHRILRIFPGFWVCLLVTAFVIAPLIYLQHNGTLAGFNFYGEDSAFSFFYRNFLLNIRQWSIGNIVNDSAFNSSLNGSLWSLYPEMQCYLLTLVIGLFGLISKNKFAFGFMLAFVYAVYVINLYSGQKIGPTFIVLSSASKLYVSFLCGTALYVYRDVLYIDLKGQLFILIASIALVKFGGFLMVEPAVIAIISVKLFASFTVRFKYDISYTTQTRLPNFGAFYYLTSRKFSFGYILHIE